MTPPTYRPDPAEKPPPQDRIESGASGRGEPLSLSRIREDPFEKQQVGKLQGDNTAQTEMRRL
jgi:hypothetical protein